MDIDELFWLDRIAIGTVQMGLTSGMDLDGNQDQRF